MKNLSRIHSASVIFPKANRMPFPWKERSFSSAVRIATENIRPPELCLNLENEPFRVNLKTDRTSRFGISNYFKGWLERILLLLKRKRLMDLAPFIFDDLAKRHNCDDKVNSSSALRGTRLVKLEERGVLTRCAQTIPPGDNPQTGPLISQGGDEAQSRSERDRWTFDGHFMKASYLIIA